MAACGTGLVGRLCTAFVPQESIQSRAEALQTVLETKFPFSLVTALSDVFVGEATGSASWPSAVGFMPLPMSELAGFFATVKAVVTVLLLVLLVWYLVDRFTPQVTV